MKNEQDSQTTNDPAVASSDLLAAWLAKLKAHAESRGLGWLIDPEGDYEEYFKDDMTPEEAFEDELDAARQCC